MKVSRQEITVAGGGMAWPEFQQTQEAAANGVSSLERAFIDPAASPLSSTISGLGLDEWLKEDFSGNGMQQMDCSISGIFGDVFPDNSEQELSSASQFGVSPSSNAVFPEKSDELDLNVEDIINSFHSNGDDARPQWAESPATSLVSAQADVASHATSPLADLRKIIVKKPVLDKAVERLGGGRDGALKLWKLIQIWLRHQKPQSKPSCGAAAVSSSHQACSDTLSQQNLLNDLMHLPSDLDLNLQDSLASRPSELHNDPNVDRYFNLSNVHDIACLHSSQISSSVVDPSLRQVSNPQTPLLTINDQPYDPASTDMGCFTNSTSSNSPPLPSAVPLISPPPELVLPHEMTESRKQAMMQAHFREKIQEVAMQQQALMRSRASFDHAAKSLPIVGDGLNKTTSIMGCSTVTAASTRAARKNRMARKRRSVMQLPKRLRKISCPSLPTDGAQLNSAFQSSNSPYVRSKVRKWPEKIVELPPEKELKPSDVGSLGKVVVPEKGGAEIHLPNLTSREGVAISMDSTNPPQALDSKCRFWSNTNSQTYSLQNTACSFEGDSKMHLKDCISENYVIGRMNAPQTSSSNLPFVESSIGSCAPFSVSTDCSIKVEESPSGVGSSSSSDLLTNNVEKMEECIFLKRKTLPTYEKMASAVCDSIQDEFSQSLQSVQDGLVEEIMQEFVNELPVLERFPSLDISDAAVDEMPDLGGEYTAQGTISDCSSKHSADLSIKSEGSSQSINQSMTMIVQNLN